MSKYYDEWDKLSAEERHRLYQIENENLYSGSEIGCPYCDEKIDIEGPELSYEEDGESEHECWSCGKKFTARCTVSYDWYTSVPQEEALEILKKELAEEQL